ncbi:unnamed protein product [Onchocerca flexuosa]|uniref:Uncharacterized protein n=1 Tax=Onchocerca flexuosa TaxID=387005 RepID=A0A183HLG5_9BILA|nr:unnamed protein product [Onchocerca flexuosa]
MLLLRSYKSIRKNWKARYNLLLANYIRIKEHRHQNMQQARTRMSFRKFQSFFFCFFLSFLDGCLRVRILGKIGLISVMTSYFVYCLIRSGC